MVPKPIARLHHHIPQGYLRGFGWKGKKFWYTNVAALRAQNWFQPNVKNIGAEKDFLRIDVEGHAPDALEKAMAGFDDQGATAIRNINDSRRFEGDDKIIVLDLIALLAVRSPQMRENLRQFQERVHKKLLGLTLATKERYEGQVNQMKEAGVQCSEDVTYEQLKEFHNRGEYDINMNREWFIGLEVQSFDVVLRTLVDRKWRLYVADETSGPFVTSDRPVVPTWNHPEKVPAMMRHSPGYGMTGTEVYFPINHDMALVGSFEDVEDGTHKASAQMVAIANTRMIEHAFEQVYTIKKVFPYIVPPSSFSQDALFMERFEVERKRRSGLARMHV